MARLGTAIIRTLQGAGIAACGKHFPGHGDTSTDSHFELPLIEHPPDRLDAVELVLPETGVCQTDLGGGSCCSVSNDTTAGVSCGTTAGGLEREWLGEPAFTGAGAGAAPAAASCCV